MITGTVTVTAGADPALVFGPLGAATTVTLIPVRGTVLLAGTGDASEAESFTLAADQQPQLVVPLNFAEGDSLYAAPGPAVQGGSVFTYIGFPS